MHFEWTYFFLMCIRIARISESVLCFDKFNSLYTHLDYVYCCPLGPLTSFLDSDGDLSKAPKFSAYSSDDGRKSPGLSRSADSSNRRPLQHTTTGGRPHHGAKFSETELKILR